MTDLPIDVCQRARSFIPFILSGHRPPAPVAAARSRSRALLPLAPVEPERLHGRIPGRATLAPFAWR
jgi:hypothetical protein